MSLTFAGAFAAKSRETIRLWIRDGLAKDKAAGTRRRLPAIRRGATYLVHREELVEFLRGVDASANAIPTPAN